MKRFFHGILSGLLIFAILGLGVDLAIPGARSPEAESVSLVFPPPPEKPRIKFIEEIRGSEGYGEKKSWIRRALHVITGKKKEKRINRPYGVEVSKEGWIYVCDTGGGVVHCFKGRDKGYFTLPKKDRLSSPIDVALDDEGRVFVTDSKEGTVFFFDRDGNFEGKFGADLRRPTGIAFHPQKKRLYVVDTIAQKVMVFSPDGSLLQEFGSRGTGEGEFNFPTDIFIDDKGLLYVSDAMNFRIQIFTPEGEYIGEFGKLGDGTGDFSRPKGVAVDGDGNIYVVDALFDAVQVFNRKGELLLVFGGPGDDPGEFWLPSGITVDAKNRILVSDSYNRRVQVFQYLGN